MASNISNNDQAAPPRVWWRRVERRLAQILLGIVALYLVLYGVSALLLQSHVNHLIAEQLGVPNAFRMSATAWPPGLALRADDVHFTSKLGETGSAESARVTLPLFAPWRTHSVLTGLAYTNPLLHVTLARLEASTPLYARKLAQYHTVVSELSVWPAGAADTTAKTALQVPNLIFDYQRRLDQHDQSAPEEESSATLAPIILPAGQAIVQPITLDRLTLRTTAEPALPRDLTNTAAVTAWQAAGGKLSIAPLELEALGTTTTLAGPITLDAQLTPTGKLTLTFIGLDKAYAALKDFNLMPAQQYQALGNLLKLMPGQGREPFDFPVSIREHAVYFMDGPIFQFKRLPWEANAEAAPVVPAAPAMPLTPADPVLPLDAGK